jgi:hypothetical protein
MNKKILVAMFSAVSFSTNANTIHLDGYSYMEYGDMQCSPTCVGLVASPNLDWSLTDASKIIVGHGPQVPIRPVYSEIANNVDYLNSILANSGSELLTGEIVSNVINVGETNSLTTTASFWSVKDNGQYTWFFNNTTMDGMPTEITGLGCTIEDQIYGCDRSIIEYNYNAIPSAVPIPAAAWLFGSALIGLLGIARRKTKA